MQRKEHSRFFHVGFFHYFRFIQVNLTSMRASGTSSVSFNLSGISAQQKSFSQTCSTSLIMCNLYNVFMTLLAVFSSVCLKTIHPEEMKILSLFC